MRSPVALVLAVLVLLAAAWAYVATRPAGVDPPGRSAAEASVEADGANASPAGADLVPEPEPAAMDPAAVLEPSTERVEPEPAPERTSVSTGFVGRVVDADGEPLPNVVVTWTALLDVPYGDKHSWRAVDRARVAEHRVETLSGADGEFRFEEAPDGAESLGSVLWFLHPEFVATPAILDPGSAPWPPGASWSLAEGSPWVARVVDGGDHAVAGATLEHFLLALGDLPREELLARALFHRTWTTGTEPITGPCAKGALVLQGRYGDLVSMPRYNSQPAGQTIAVELLETFFARGSVTADGEPADVEGGVVSCYLVTEDNAIWMLDRSIPRDGQWGPVALPTREDQYLFSFTAEDSVPDEHYERNPAAGSTLTVDFETRPGFDFEIRVREAGAEPVEGARAVLFQLIDGNWVQSDVRTDAEGVARFQGVGEGTGWAQVVSDGFVGERKGPIAISADEPLVEFELAPAGVVRGRVTHGGAPVTAFDLVYWQGDPTEFQNKRIRRDSGEFEIADAPLGEISLIAASLEHPRSSPVTVRVDRDVPAEGVVIELPTTARARGRLVALGKDAPPPGAQIQVYVSTGAQAFMNWGQPQPVEEDGSFDITGIGPGDNQIGFFAKGYTTYVATVHSAGGEDVDLGTVSLAPTVSFGVRVAPTDGVERDWGGWTLVVGSGPGHVPALPLDAGGRAVHEAINVGSWIADLEHPGGFSLRFRQDLQPGEVVERVVPVGPARLEVEVDDPGDGSPRVEHVEVEVRGPEGPHVARAELDGDRVELVDLIVGPASIRLLDPDGRQLAFQRIELAPGRNSARVALSKRTLRVRVVSTAGEGLSGAFVTVTAPDEDPHWRLAGHSDEWGVWTARGVPYDRILLSGHHPDHGSRSGFFAEVAGGDGDVELVLDGEAAVRARLVDRGEPLGGVRARLRFAKADLDWRARTTSADGKLEFDRFSAGEYRLLVEQDGYWPTEALVEATADGGFVDVEVPRLGRLELQLGASSAERAAARLDLRHEELGGSVAEWIAAGRVRSSTGGLAFADDGTLAVDGLPRGEYAWRLEAGGGVAAGRLSVPVGGTAVERLEIER